VCRTESDVLHAACPSAGTSTGTADDTGQRGLPRNTWFRRLAAEGAGRWHVGHAKEEWRAVADQILIRINLESDRVANIVDTVLYARHHELISRVVIREQHVVRIVRPYSKAWCLELVRRGEFISRGGGTDGHGKLAQTLASVRILTVIISSERQGHPACLDSRAVGRRGLGAAERKVQTCVGNLDICAGDINQPVGYGERASADNISSRNLPGRLNGSGGA
jgi:hypothetical protein